MKLKINLRQYTIDAVYIEGVLYVNTEQVASIVGGAPQALLKKEFIGLEELSSLLEDQFKRGNRGAINFYEGLLNDVAYKQVCNALLKSLEMEKAKAIARCSKSLLWPTVPYPESWELVKSNAPKSDPREGLIFLLRQYETPVSEYELYKTLCPDVNKLEMIVTLEALHKEGLIGFQFYTSSGKLIKKWFWRGNEDDYREPPSLEQGMADVICTLDDVAIERIENWNRRLIMTKKDPDWVSVGDVTFRISTISGIANNRDYGQSAVYLIGGQTHTTTPAQAKELERYLEGNKVNLKVEN